jgi:hypothetical protein
MGDAEGMDELLEADSIPAEILAANPSIKTFNTAFEGCTRVEES